MADKPGAKPAAKGAPAKGGAPKGGAPKSGKSYQLGKLYDAKGDSLKRLRKSCPKCGDGCFLAEHKNRVSCGRCHYTEFQKK